MIKYILLILSFFIMIATKSQNNSFYAAYGGLSYNYGVACINWHNNTHTIIGNSSSYGNQSMSIYLCNIDSTGQIIKDTIIGNTGIDFAYSATKLSDTEFIITGYSNSFSNNYQAYILLINSKLNIQKEIYFGSSDWVYAHSATKTNNAYYIVGETYENTYGASDILLLKYDLSWNLLWQKQFGGNFSDIGKNIFAYNDSLYLFGHTQSFGNGKNDIFFLKTTLAGDSVFFNTYGTEYDEVCNQAIFFDDSTLFFGGIYTKEDTEQWGSIFKTDINGNILYNNLSSGYLLKPTNSMAKYNNNQLIIAGYDSTSLYAGSKDTYFAYLSNTGNPLGGKIEGSMDEEYFNHVSITQNNELLFVGTTNHHGYGINNIWVLKTDSTLSIPDTVHMFSKIEKTQQNNNLSIYPNPTNKNVNIVSKNTKITSIQVYTALGQCVYEKNNIYDNACFLNESFPYGYYYLRLKLSNNQTITKKIVFIK